MLLPCSDGSRVLVAVSYSGDEKPSSARSSASSCSRSISRKNPKRTPPEHGVGERDIKRELCLGVNNFYKMVSINESE